MNRRNVKALLPSVTRWILVEVGTIAIFFQGLSSCALPEGNKTFRTSWLGAISSEKALPTAEKRKKKKKKKNKSMRLVHPINAHEK